MKVGIVSDPIYLEHDTGSHVENKERLVAITRVLTESRLMAQLIPVSPRMATVAELLAVHSPELVERVEAYARRGGGWLDGDTVTSAGSYKAALYAAGGLLRATDAVMNGEIDSGFALVRPPGHHATRNQAMGFCLFNNVAIAARYALQEHRLERVLIADFDVHHGNGTQEAFYDDPRVLYFSTHQYPHYPGTGRVEETGTGAGVGTNVNVPLPAGCGDAEYSRIYREILGAAARRFRPQLIFVSAGYDPHWADHLAMMQLTVTGFADIVSTIKGLADELCDGRVLFTLEGGYNTEALACSVKATFDVLLGHNDIEDPLGKPRHPLKAEPIERLLETVKKVHHL